ncbi:MAG: arabinofuranosidase catalytic domain-containing protein [Steroidobacteraceae bacterium]
MKTRIMLVLPLALALMLPAAQSMDAAQAGRGGAALSRPQGPCDIYAAAGAPCVAAHSSTRALSASYNGPLYQVMRQSDSKTLDIGVVPASARDAGGYANAAAQDAFCVNTYCWITTLYDQSGKRNHLVQAPRGGFSGPAMGGFNNLPLADMAPVTLNGRKVYGIFIAPGMGLRWNDARGTAVDDQAEGQYWVISGHHYNSGCCFDYGNAETDSRDDGDGTMETTYFGNATAWYRGQPPGPWIMTDQENNLVGCVNDSPNDKYCPNVPTITWRFVTATADGEPHHWRSLGADSQQGALKVMFDGPRIKNDRSSYDPMRKQGAILLGNGGDNSMASQGTFYEAAMTAPNTFPSLETNQRIQANIVAARYDVQRLTVTPAGATTLPPGLQTFSPRSSQDTAVTFRNTAAVAVTDVKLSIAVPAQWAAVAATSATFAGPVAPGASVSATFKVTSGPASFNGDLVGRASWTANGVAQSETTSQKVRNVSAIKLNEFRVSAGATSNPTDSFIELYNAGASAVDISNWTLTQHPTQQPIFSSVKIPAGTTLAAKGFYLLGLANSGLAVPAKKSDAVVHVRSTVGMSVGDTIEIGNGPQMERRTIAKLGTAAGNPTTLWQPLPDGPVTIIPKGSTNVPFTGAAGFAVEVGQKIGVGYGATYPTVANSVEKYEVVTVTAVGKPGTQAWLSMDAKAGDRNIKVSSVTNISPGDKIRLDIDSLGHGIETVTVTKVGTASIRNTFNAPLRSGEDPGTGLDLAEPLKFNHASNMPFSARGTGITFQPASAFAHSSNEPILPLGTGITLERPLGNNHDIHASVRSAAPKDAGYQGTTAPNQWFGGPALANAGTMVLRDAGGLVVDSLNYGGLVDPWASEGYQAESGAGRSGCFAPPIAAGGGRGAPVGPTPNRSAGRFPDGIDTDSNCRDFLLQSASNLSADSAPGANNIKVTSLADFRAGQMISIDSGVNREAAVIATVGTLGATTVSTPTQAGATVIPVANAAGFTAGQAITIGGGTNVEAAVVATVAVGGRGGGGPSITVTAPLKLAQAAGVQVSGSGITLNAALTKAHQSGAQIAENTPTPGAANQYARRPQ